MTFEQFHIFVFTQVQLYEYKDSRQFREKFCYDRGVSWTNSKVNGEECVLWGLSVLKDCALAYRLFLFKVSPPVYWIPPPSRSVAEFVMMFHRGILISNPRYFYVSGCKNMC
jgi:hypothetical protein